MSAASTASPNRPRTTPPIFALFDFKAKDEDLTDPTRAIGRAEVIQVEPASSSIELEGVADPDAGPFKAIILHQPTTKLRVALEEDEAGVCLIQAALNAAGPGGEPSLFVRPTEGQEAPDYRVIAREGRYLIVQPGDDRPLVEPLKGFTRDSARRIVERLEHIERWKTTAELQNPNTSIGEGDLEVKVIYRGEELKAGNSDSPTTGMIRPGSPSGSRTTAVAPSSSACSTFLIPSASSHSSPTGTARSWEPARRQPPTTASRCQSMCPISSGSWGSARSPTSSRSSSARGSSTSGG